MSIVTEISWEQVADPACTPHTRQAFRTAVTTVADRARAAIPASHTASTRPKRSCWLATSRSSRVAPPVWPASARAPRSTVWSMARELQGLPQAPDGWCKHRLSAAIARRVQGLRPTQTGEELAVRHQVAPPRGGTIPRAFFTTIHGKEFVQFAGLLAMAHAQGLTSLSAELVSVTLDLALAKATATFADGRTFTEAADATPDNVNAGVRKHFARCALTRAKARALRDALNISTCAVEELD